MGVNYKVELALNDNAFVTYEGAAIDPETAREAVEKLVSGSEVVVTRDSTGDIVAVTRQDEEGKILSVIAEKDEKKPGVFRVGDRVVFNQDYIPGNAKKGDTGTVMKLENGTLVKSESGNLVTGPMVYATVNLDKNGECPIAFAYRLDHLEEKPKLRVGAKIRITRPYCYSSYKEGDVLTVKSINTLKGVYVQELYGVYISPTEYEVVG